MSQINPARARLLMLNEERSILARRRSGPTAAYSPDCEAWPARAAYARRKAVVEPASEF